MTKYWSLVISVCLFAKPNLNFQQSLHAPLIGLSLPPFVTRLVCAWFPIFGESLMCGIVGYVGNQEATPILLQGLKRLEYRGYDSAGVATLTGSHLHVCKRAGRLAALSALVEEKPAPGHLGIGHTRWATH